MSNGLPLGSWLRKMWSDTKTTAIFPREEIAIFSFPCYKNSGYFSKISFFEILCDYQRTISGGRYFPLFSFFLPAKREFFPHDHFFGPIAYFCFIPITLFFLIDIVVIFSCFCCINFGFPPIVKIEINLFCFCLHTLVVFLFLYPLLLFCFIIITHFWLVFVVDCSVWFKSSHRSSTPSPRGYFIPILIFLFLYLYSN